MEIFLVFVIIAGAIYFIITGIFAPPEERVRLTEGPRYQFSISASTGFLRKVSCIVNAPFLNTAYVQNLQAQTEFLKLPFGAPELLIIKEILMVLLGILVYVLFPTYVNYALIAAPVAFIAPDIMLINKVKAKKEAIIKFFPETVDLLDLCIGAGLDFLSSVRWIIEKSHSNPFIEQLEIVVSEIQVGKNRGEALKSMANRIKIPDISSFARTIIQAERMGTSIEEALKNLSEDTRMARFQRGERYAIKASLKILFPLLFCILPVIMIVVAGPIIIKFTQGGLIPGTK